jgi:hypothetical protein
MSCNYIARIGTNTLAYFEHLLITDVKSFVTFAQVRKLSQLDHQDLRCSVAESHEEGTIL